MRVRRKGGLRGERGGGEVMRDTAGKAARGVDRGLYLQIVRRECAISIQQRNRPPSLPHTGESFRLACPTGAASPPPAAAAAAASRELGVG